MLCLDSSKPMTPISPSAFLITTVYVESHQTEYPSTSVASLTLFPTSKLWKNASLLSFQGMRMLCICTSRFLMRYIVRVYTISSATPTISTSAPWSPPPPAEGSILRSFIKNSGETVQVFYCCVKRFATLLTSPAPMTITTSLFETVSFTVNIAPSSVSRCTASLFRSWSASAISALVLVYPSSLRAA